MSNEHLKSQQPDQNDKAVSAKNSDTNIALDDMGIPILEEIVAHKEDTNPNKKAPTKNAAKASKRNLSLPNNEILVKALRNQLRSQVKKDLEDISKDVAANVVSSITPELERKIREHIAMILENNLDAMIKKAISGIPKRK